MQLDKVIRIIVMGIAAVFIMAIAMGIIYIIGLITTENGSSIAKCDQGKQPCYLIRGMIWALVIGSVYAIGFVIYKLVRYIFREKPDPTMPSA